MSLRVVAAVSCGILALTGCSGPADPSTADPSGGESSPSTSTSEKTGSAENVTSCRDLLDSDWQPPEGEPQLGYDPATGLATIYLPKRDLLVNIRDDAACRDLPDYGPILEQILKDAREF